MSRYDMDIILGLFDARNLTREALELSPADFDTYLNFYNTDGAKWTVWFKEGQRYFLDGAYGEGLYIWRYWKYFPSNGNTSRYMLDEQVNQILSSYEPDAAPPGEPFNTFPDLLVLPEDRQAAETVKSAAAKNIFPLEGFLDGLSAPVSRRELYDLIGRTLVSAEHGLESHYSISVYNTFAGLLSESNANALAYGDFREDGAFYYDLYEYGEYWDIAAYISIALGLDVDEDKDADYYKDIIVTRDEAARTLDAVMTLVTGSTKSGAILWFDGDESEPITRLDALSALLVLYDNARVK
jgi:hypothetical protein